MTVSFNIDSLLKGTRDNLADVCQDLDIEMPDPKTLKVAQCINCGIWGSKYKEMYDDETCHFCNDMDTLRF